MKVEKIVEIITLIKENKIEEGKRLVKAHQELFNDIALNGGDGIISIEKLDVMLEVAHKQLLNKIEYLEALADSVADYGDIEHAWLCLSTAYQI